MSLTASDLDQMSFSKNIQLQKFQVMIFKIKEH